MSFLSAIVLLFNPLYFNMSNTYMTDINFNTLLILVCYNVYRFFRTESLINYLFVFVFSLLLMFVRQYGIIAPFVFTISCLVIKSNKLIYFAVSILFTFLLYQTLKQYETFLILQISPWATYKFLSYPNRSTTRSMQGPSDRTPSSPSSRWGARRSSADSVWEKWKSGRSRRTARPTRSRSSSQ